MTNLPLQSLSEVPGSPRKPEPPKVRGKRGTRDAVKRVSLPGMWRLPAKSPETTPAHIYSHNSAILFTLLLRESSAPKIQHFKEYNSEYDVAGL